MRGKDVAQPGDTCTPDHRKNGAQPAHKIEHPDDDVDLQAVKTWLQLASAPDALRTAVDASIKYVLDGPRTYRFDLMAKDVDTDERSSVGTKLQYHVIEQFGLMKQPPLDTHIAGVPVEIKGTTRPGNGWPVMIPREGQCELTLMIQLSVRSMDYRFRCSLLRTHRAWLSGQKGNRDLKRSPLVQAADAFSVEIAPWTDLPVEPLRLLTPAAIASTFDPSVGLRRRAVRLFSYLPSTVIPRSSLEIVGAKNKDFMKRFREAKTDLLKLDLVVLVGTWTDQRALAKKLGFELGDESWIALPRAEVERVGFPGSFLSEMQQHLQ